MIKRLVAIKIVPEDEIPALEGEIEALWQIPLFARCKKPIPEACGDWGIVKFILNNITSMNTETRIMALISHGYDIHWEVYYGE